MVTGGRWMQGHWQLFSASKGMSSFHLETFSCSGRLMCGCRWLSEQKSRIHSWLIGTILFHVPKGATTDYPLVSQSYSSITPPFFPFVNLFAKEIEA